VTGVKVESLTNQTLGNFDYFV